MTSLQDIFKGQLGPYKPKLTLTIVGVNPIRHYQVDGEDRQMRIAVGTDGEQYARVHLYDKTKFARLAVGNVLSLLNIITKKEDGCMVVIVTKNSKIFCGKTEEVAENQKAAANNILNPPPAATIAIAKALSSPPKTKVSIWGKIVQEAQPQTVRVKGEDVPIKSIHVEDKSGKAKVTLWREAVATQVRPGDFVRITDAIPNTWKNEMSLSTTSKSVVEKCDAPIERMSGTVIGTSLEDTIVELLLSNDDVISVQEALMTEALTDTDFTIEGLANNGPIDITYSLQGDDVIEIELS